MTEHGLSVVVPIYNVEDYLHASLNSLKDQTIFQSLEIILIDDGSTDNSQMIAKEFSKANANVRYVRKKNAGLGAARNTGMELATRDFITFLDSDDLLTPNAYELLLEPFRNNRINVTVGRMKSFPIETQLSWERALSRGSRRWAGISQMPDLIHSASACNKIFRVSTIQEAQLRFREHVHFEDAHFVVPMLMLSPVIEVIDDIVYLYRKRVSRDSIMDSLFTNRQNYWDYVTLIESLREFSATLPLDEVQYVDDFIIRGFPGFLLRAEKILSAKETGKFYERSFEVINTIDPSVILRSTHNAKHRIPYAFLLEHRSESTTRREPHKHPVVVTEAGPALEYFKHAKAKKLVSTKSFTVAAESISSRGGMITIEGRITARGLPFTTKPNIELSLVVGNRTFPATWIRRHDRMKNDGEWVGFSAVVPANRWPRGEYYPRVRLRTGDNQLEYRAFKTIALFRNFKPFITNNKFFTLRINAKNQMGIVVTTAEKSRTKRYLSRLTADTKAFMISEPYSKERLLRTITHPFARKNTVLISERHDTAQDNGYALFNHISQRADSPKTYYLIDKNSSKYRDLKRIGNVIKRDTIRHKWHMLHARTVINSFDVDSYSIPSTWAKSAYVEHLLPHLSQRRVFLQHGVSFRHVAPGLHRLVQGYDLVVTSSRKEQEYFSRELSYGSRAVLTGMPRFSTLERKRTYKQRRVLFAPTWRTGLVKPSYNQVTGTRYDDSFSKTLYCRSIMDFLTDSKLLELLKEKNIILSFLPHYEVADYFTDNINGMFGIEVLKQSEINFQDTLNSCDIFITDYSSTFFDVAFLGIPVIHWFFDSDSYDKSAELGLFDIHTQGFGPVLYSVDKLVESLTAITNCNYERADLFETRAQQYFAELPDNSVSEVANKIFEL